MLRLWLFGMSLCFDIVWSTGGPALRLLGPGSTGDRRAAIGGQSHAVEAVVAGDVKSTLGSFWLWRSGVYPRTPSIANAEADPAAGRAWEPGILDSMPEIRRKEAGKRRQQRSRGASLVWESGGDGGWGTLALSLSLVWTFGEPHYWDLHNRRWRARAPWSFGCGAGRGERSKRASSLGGAGGTYGRKRAG